MSCSELCKVLEDTITLVKLPLENEDTPSELEVAMQNIFNYMKNLIRDVQRKGAKTYAFDNLSEETGFWLKDFRQKVLKFREG